MLWFVDGSFVSFCHLVVVMPSWLSTKAVIIFLQIKKCFVIALSGEKAFQEGEVGCSLV